MQSALRKEFRSLSLALCIFSLLSGVAYASDQGEISGTVLSPEGKAAIQAKVSLKRADGTVLSETTTSDDGKFQFFPVTIGDYDVCVEESSAAPYSYSAHVASGGNAYTEVQLSPLTPKSGEMVVEVRSKKRLIHTSSSVSSTEVSQAEIKKLPQGSEISLPRLLSTTTPGVVPGAFGQLFFRGNHANIQYQIDGVQLPDSPSNAFGQAFSPRNIDRMEVITGGIPAEYGQRLGAVINVVTKTGPETPEGEVELNYGSYNAITPHLLYGGTNKKGDVRYFLSLNYNQTDRGLDTPQPESIANQKQGGTESVHNRASGNSEFGRIDWQIDNQNKFVFSTFHSQSNFQIPNFPSTFDINDSFFTRGYVDQFGNSDSHHPINNYAPADTNDTQAETNFYVQGAWKHTFSKRSFFQLAPYYKYSRIVVTNDPTKDLASRGVITKANPTSFSMDRHVNNLGLKGDFSQRTEDGNTFGLPSSHLIKAGFQFQASRSDGYFSIQTDLTKPILANSDPAEGYFESLYLQDDITLNKRLTLNLGMRFDATQFVFSGVTANDYQFQPRLGANYMLSDSTKIHAFYGKLFQPAPVENLRSTYSALDPTVITPYDIKAEKADYFEVGVAHQVLEKQVAALNVYYKTGVNFLDDAQLLRTSIAQPFNFAEGRAYGVEFSLKGQISSNWSNFFNYSYQIAEGKDISGGIWAVEEDHLNPNGGFMMLDHVQVHTANAGVTYTRGNFWWTTLAQYGSGLRTGPENSLKLPDRFTFDTTVGYEFKGDSWLSQSKISFDVLNILDNRYPITISNGFNGSHYAQGRAFYIRIAKKI